MPPSLPTPKPPILPPRLQESFETQIALKDAAAFESAKFTDCVFSGSKASSVKFEGASLINCDLSNSELKKLELTDVKLERGLIFAVKWDGVAVQRTEFRHSMMSGAVLSDAFMKDVVFIDCKLDLANFRFSKLTRVTFKNCLLSEADFQGAELTDVTFETCELTDTDFSNVKLKQVDLRSSSLANIKGATGLKGAIVSSTQLIELAPILAAGIGLIVSDE